MNNCPACGRPAIGVCEGPHPGYQLRATYGDGMKPHTYVELPDWWRCRIPQDEMPRDDPDVHLGVTASGDIWRIHYDPAQRLRLQQEAEAIAQEATRMMRERAERLALLHELAEEFGMVLRPKMGAMAR